MRMAVIGCSQVGKTSLANRYTLKSFIKNIAETKQTQFPEKLTPLKSDKHINVKIIISDTVPYEDWQGKTSSHLSRSCAVFIVFDVSNKKSFEKTKDLIEYCNEKITSNDILKYLVGAKSDIQPR